MPSYQPILIIDEIFISRIIVIDKNAVALETVVYHYRFCMTIGRIAAGKTNMVSYLIKSCLYGAIAAVVYLLWRRLGSVGIEIPEGCRNYRNQNNYYHQFDQKHAVVSIAQNCLQGICGPSKTMIIANRMPIGNAGVIR
jgi:hypothetical protein